MARTRVLHKPVTMQQRGMWKLVDIPPCWSLHMTEHAQISRADKAQGKKPTTGPQKACC